MLLILTNELVDEFYKIIYTEFSTPSKVKIQAVRCALKCLLKQEAFLNALPVTPETRQKLIEIQEMELELTQILKKQK